MDKFPSIKKVKTIDLIPYARNSRTHSDEQINQIAASIKEFGFLNPIIIDGENGIIAGHGRVMAANKLNIKELPCVDASHLSETQRRAYVIADNKLALNSGWDIEMLRVEFDELQEAGFDLELTGFSMDEIADLQIEELTEGLTDEDETPECPDVTTAVLGDIWQLGNHRLMCGDSTSIDAVEKLVADNKIDVLFTDPPYGIDFKPQRGTHDKIMNDNLDGKAFDDFLDAVFGCAISVMKPDTYAFVWTGWSKIGVFERSLHKVFKIQALHIWVKNNFGIGYYSRPKHEPFYLCLNGKPVYPSKAPADVWEFARVHKTIHSCEKPVGLIGQILDTYHKNSHVLDLFGGSGSTLIACEKTGRNAYLMELDPKYIDVIITRWQNFTGKEAVHIESGKTFNELKAERDNG